MTIRQYAAVAAFALFAGSAVAQPPVGQPPANEPPTGTPGTVAPAAQAFRAKQVLGSKVSIQGDIGIGTVDDIVFDDSGSVEYLIVVNEGKLATIPWNAAKFNFEKQMATVNITQQQYRVIPTYTVRQLPNYWTPTYRTETYRFFGLTPLERRRDRR